MRINTRVAGPFLLIFLVAFGSLALLTVSQAGNWIPPGDPGSTMKSLDLIYPVWTQRLRADDGVPCNSSRFRCVLDDELVLDMETGLAWARGTGPTSGTWSEAKSYCYQLVAGARSGFRLPTAEELASLLECTGPSTDPCRLPQGNPFNVTEDSRLWSITTHQNDPTAAWVLVVNQGELSQDYKEADRSSLCVRGKHGFDSR